MIGRLGDVGRGLAVTGTDTGVGKTLVSAALCVTLRAAGADVTYVKPAQSGTADGDDDARDVLALAGVPTAVGPALGEPLAPSVAARRAGREVTGPDLAAVVTAALAGAPDVVPVVEGAGGILVELGTDGTTLVDLVREFDLGVVVVARPGLGTLNHTALTLEALASRGLRTVGVVVSGFPPDPDLATRTNLAELDRLADARGTALVGVVPLLAQVRRDALAVAPTWFTSVVGGTADRADLLRPGA